MVQLDSIVTIHKNALITVQSSRKDNPVVKRCQITQYPEENHLRNLTLGKSRDLKKNQSLQSYFSNILSFSLFEILQKTAEFLRVQS